MPGKQDLALDGIVPGEMISRGPPGRWRLGHVPHLILGMDPGSPHFANMIQTFNGGGSGDRQRPRVLVNTFQELEASALEALRARGVRITPVGPTLAADSTAAVADDAGNKFCPPEKQNS
jgi:hypothetical protein